MHRDRIDIGQVDNLAAQVLERLQIAVDIAEEQAFKALAQPVLNRPERRDDDREDQGRGTDPRHQLLADPGPLMEHNQADAVDAEQPDPDHESHQPTAQNADNTEELPARYGGGRKARREEHHAEDGELGLDHVIEAEQERHQAEHAERSDAGDAADGDQAERPARALILRRGLHQVQDDQSDTTQQAHSHEEEGRARSMA
jgi:hypothetical protein